MDGGGVEAVRGRRADTPALDRNHAVINQNGVPGVEETVIAAVDGQPSGSDPDVGVAAGHITPDRKRAFPRDVFGLWRGEAIAVGDDNGVGSGNGFDPSEQQVVAAAAGGKKSDPQYHERGLHERTINYFAIQSQQATARFTQSTL